MRRRQRRQLQQGQDVVVSTLQQKFNSTASVSIDTEMSNLIALAEFLCRECPCDVGGSKHDEYLAPGSTVRRSR